MDSTNHQQEEDQDQNNLYIPGLSNPGLIQKLPKLTGFQRLISKNDAHQQTNSNPTSTHSPDQLIKSCAWRALADLTHQLIINSEPSNTSEILKLWSYRFQALYQLRMPTIIWKELLGLFQTISQTFPLTEILLNLDPETLPSLDSNDHQTQKKAIPDLIPFSILVLRARLPVLLRPNDHESVLKTSDGLFQLLEGSKRMLAYYQQSTPPLPTQEALWKSRIVELVGLLVSLYAGHGFQFDPILDEKHKNPGPESMRPFIPDRTLSTELIQSIVERSSSEKEGPLEMRWIEEEAILWIEAGDFERADQLLGQLIHQHEPHPLQFVRLIADGQLDLAVELADQTLKAHPPRLDSLRDLDLINNACIALLYAGKLNQAFPAMKTVMMKLGTRPDNSPSQAESDDPREGLEQVLLLDQARLNSLIFNYATLVELKHGAHCDEVKVAFIRLLLANFSWLDQPLFHPLLDRFSLASLKLPPAYLDSL